MSPSSLLAAQTAADAPTFPAPIMLIFGRRITSFQKRGDYGESSLSLQLPAHPLTKGIMLKRRIGFALLFLFILTGKSPAAPQAIEFTDETLPNGLRVIYAP